MSTTEAQSPATKPQRMGPVNAYPWWAVRIWSGMRISHYWTMLRRHGFRIHPSRWAMTLIIGQMTPWNSFFCIMQWLFLRRRIDKTELQAPPVFIIGHWRSGTTYLHELLIRDERFGYATTYQCFAPWHFLITEWFFARLLRFLLPAKRPMDNMATGMHRPQEDEFAIAVMGAPSMYFRIGFPNDPPEHLDTLNMHGLSREDRKSFVDALTYLYKALTLKTKKRLLLKSPPHTGRVQYLSRMFPGAKFVHISRSPYEIVPSTKRCWQSLHAAQGFQLFDGTDAELEGFVHSAYEAMYDGYDRQVEQLAPQEYCEVRYEDLAKQPVDTLRSIYDQLGLEGYDQVLPALQQYVATLKDYQPNRLPLAPEVKEQIDQRWGWYLSRFGY